MSVGAAAIPYREWQLIGVYARCEACAKIRLVDPGDYDGFAPDLPQDPSALITQTNPRVRGRPATANGHQTRSDQILACFLSANDAIVRHVAADAWDPLTAGLFLGAIATFVGGAFLNLPFQPIVAQAGAFAIPALLLSGGILRRMTDLARFGRRSVLPGLAKELSALGATRAEIEQAFEKLRRMGARVASILTPQMIVDRSETPSVDIAASRDPQPVMAHP